MKHLIISRVNIPRELDPSKYDEPALYKKKEWNLERIRLLNRFTRPSIRKQTNQNFTFITLWNRDYIDFRGKLENEIPIFIDRGVDAQDEIPFDFKTWNDTGEIVKEEMDFWNQIRERTYPYSGDDYTLVTSLDSDDCLKFDFIERIQKIAPDYLSKSPCYLDVHHRYCYNIKDGRTGFKRSRYASPMSTSVEKDYECWPLKYHHSFISKHINGSSFKELQALQTVSGTNIFSRGIGKRCEVDLSQFY